MMMRFTAVVTSAIVTTAGAARVGLLRIEAPGESLSGQTSLTRQSVAALRSLFEDDADMAFRELFKVGRGGSMSFSLSFSMPQLSLSFSMPNPTFFGNNDVKNSIASLAPVTSPISLKDSDESTLVVDGEKFMGFENVTLGAQMALAVTFLAVLSVGATLLIRKRQQTNQRDATSIDVSLEESPSVFGEESVTGFATSVEAMSVPEDQI